MNFPDMDGHWAQSNLNETSGRLPASELLLRPRRADTTNDQPLSLLPQSLPPRKKQDGIPFNGPTTATVNEW